MARQDDRRKFAEWPRRRAARDGAKAQTIPPRPHPKKSLACRNGDCTLERMRPGKKVFMVWA